MDFHLIYQGKLPAASQASTRAREKHNTRKVLHLQLVSLWQTHPFLSDFLKQDSDGPPDKPKHNFANRYRKFGYRFLPLVSEWFGVSCSLDILFLRRDGPGSLVRSGGDIDNRLKVLFDGLRMPQNAGEVCGQSPAPGEDPFFRLLEDDKLITKVQVETNWLLTPPMDGEHPHDVHLIIRVKTILAEGSNKYETAFQ